MAKKAASRPGSAARPTSKPGTTKPGAKPAGKGPAPNFTERLESLGDAWNETREKKTEQRGAGFFNDNVPEGDYIARLTANSIKAYKTGNKTGVQYWAFSFTILDEAYSGQVVRASVDISNDELGTTGKTHLDILKDTLTHLGVDVKKIKSTDFPQVTLWLLDKAKNKNARPVVKISVKNSFYDKDDGTSGKSQRIYVNAPTTREELETLGIESGE